MSGLSETPGVNPHRIGPLVDHCSSGVPKTRDDAKVSQLGLLGTTARQSTMRPRQSFLPCILLSGSIPQAEGHPIDVGTVGENVTVKDRLGAGSPRRPRSPRRRGYPRGNRVHRSLQNNQGIVHRRQIRSNLGEASPGMEQSVRAGAVGGRDPLRRSGRTRLTDRIKRGGRQDPHNGPTFEQ